jgi:hypothetical protein
MEAGGRESFREKAAALFLSAFGDVTAAQGRPMWLQLLAVPDDESKVSIAFSADEDALLGWHAPPECMAVGTVATGTICQEVEHGPEGYLGKGRTRQTGVRMACVLWRDGKLDWKLEAGSGGQVTSVL